MKNPLLLFLLPLVLTLGCGKDDEENAPPHKIVGTWQVTKVESKLPGQEWLDTNEACRLDNTEEYKADGTWTHYDGADQCSPGSGVLGGTWKLAASDTRVVYTYNVASGEYESTVEQLTETNMVLTNSTGTTTGEQTRTSYKKL